MKRFIFFALIVSFFTVSLGAEDVISEFTRQKVEDFVTYRVILKSVNHEDAWKKIDELKKEALAELPEHAKDFEQEKCLLESLYFAEYYEHALNSSGNQKELRAEMKRLMKNNFACIEKRKDEQVCDWMFQLTGDVTAYYMTRSVAATFFYGMKVKGFYERAVEANKKRAISYVSLGNWCFYAPGIFGGGKTRARRHFESALKCAEIPGEKYLVYIALSQIQYEAKKTAAAKGYLQKAVDLDLGRKDLDFIARCNEKGYSYFQYLRNRSGIDEEMAEDEKDDEDR
ncbi:hypothetical protein [uncultured Treponema sp.]|uniref:hypothetical protein n=1 Tax=uncultured Treponema sp. TaxID=162155 RepID=UPI0025EC314B|nr:hypothetical protein [uncultured Treponema sp.]